jgi:GNAT superfamily N-acetyltransferase
MIVTAPNLIASTDSAVEVLEVEPGERSLLRLVAQEHPPFLPYYESPTSGTTLCSVQHAGVFAGGVLLEREPAAAESDRDAALAALFIAGNQRNRGLGSAAIVAVSRLLLSEGYERVLALWVWSVQMYERLGFEFWRTRSVDR